MAVQNALFIFFCNNKWCKMHLAFASGFLKMRLRIGPKILVLTLGVAVPSLLLFSFLMYNSRSEILQANITRQLNGLATLSFHAAQDLVGNSKKTLLAIAVCPDVQELVRSREVGDKAAFGHALVRLEKTFLEFQHLDRTIQAIRFIDSHGYVLVKVREEEIIPRHGPRIPAVGMAAVSSQAERDFFRNAIQLEKGKVWVSNFERGWMEGEEYWCPGMVRFATPVFFADGKPAGVVIINVWGEAIGTMINRLIPQEEGSAFLVERNIDDPERHGIYLFHPNRNCEFGNQTGSKITALQDYPKGITASWMSEDMGINRHPQTRDILVHRYFSPYGSSRHGWVIVVNAKRNFFMSPLITLEKAIIVSAGLVLSFMVLAAFFFARTITKPLRAVIDGAHEISRDLGSRIQVASKDEIGTLAAEINQMAATLEQNLEEKQRVEEQIRQSEKLASIGEMAAGLAHELNTPLSNIRALASLARKDLEAGKVDPSAIADDFKDISGQTEKCSQIISGLLGFARKQKSEFVLHNVNELIKNAITLVRIKSEEKDIGIDFISNDHLPHIKVDGHQIEQVAVNILLNALDAMGPGGRIVVRTDFSRGVVGIRFSDTGAGIKPEIVGKIFDPFFTTKDIGKGTGLGLSLSYGIVKNHGGAIEVESSEGKGTVFAVLLPVADRGGQHNG